MQPAEQLWNPSVNDPAGNGFIAYRGLYVAGMGDPAAAYMDRVHGWGNLHLYPGDDPALRIPEIPRAIHTFGVFLRHPHPDHPAAASTTTPGA